MLLSGVLCTARREPQFKWMADSLVENLNRNPDVAFELIVVDKLLWEDGSYIIGSAKGNAGLDVDLRRRQLAEAVNGRFSFRHTPPKPSAWQGPWRKTLRDYYDLNGARNSGIALARGSYIVFIDDCSVLGDSWLRWHAEAAKRKTVAVAGSFKSYTETTKIEGCTVEGTLHPCGNDGRGEVAIDCTGGWLWGLNTGFPIEAAFAVNGYDEYYSGQGGSEDADFGVRIERAGYKVAYVPQCKIYQILSTHEPVCETGTWGNPSPTPQKELQLRDGKMHFANERLIERLFEEPTRTAPLGNDFNLRLLHEACLLDGYSAFSTKRKVEIDWRDGKKLEECR